MARNSIDVDSAIHEILDSGGVVIRGYRSRDELVRTMQTAINDGKKCVFVPTQRTLREFLNTDGFIEVMDQVNAQLENHDVLIEANSYGSQHVFAVGPRSRSDELQHRMG